MDVMPEWCEHAGTGVTQRGANGTMRHVVCKTCQRFLCRVSRWRSARNSGVGLWTYLITILYTHRDGQ
eukprot:777128-Amphidinium_carterae.1